MIVDKHKKEHLVNAQYGFWKAENVIHVPIIPIGLYKLLDDTMKKLNQIYIPNAWLWVKLRKKYIYQEIRDIEESINIAIQEENKEYLQEALRMYYEKWVEVIVEFEPIRYTFAPF